MQHAEHEVTRLRTAEKLSYDYPSTGYSLLTLQTVLSDYFMTPGDAICRGDFPSDYSILVQFAVDNSQVQFNFLNITNNFALSLDMCTEEIVVSFMAPGCLRTMKVPVPENTVFNKLTYHKLGVKVTNESVQVEFDCFTLDKKEMDMSSCPVHCSSCEDIDVHILQPLPSKCARADYEKVRNRFTDNECSCCIEHSVKIFLCNFYIKLCKSSN